MQIRRFSADLKAPIPGPHRGLHGVPIQLDHSAASAEESEALARRFNGLPILLNRPAHVVALYLDPHGAMDEHSADVPILFLVLEGHGYVRINGPDGETRSVRAGDAILWPAGLDHTVWTDDEALSAIVMEGPGEREATAGSITNPTASARVVHRGETSGEP